MIEGAVVVAAPLAAQVGPTMSVLSEYLGNIKSTCIHQQATRDEEKGRDVCRSSQLTCDRPHSPPSKLLCQTSETQKG